MTAALSVAVLILFVLAFRLQGGFSSSFSCPCDSACSLPVHSHRFCCYSYWSSTSLCMEVRPGCRKLSVIGFLFQESIELRSGFICFLFCSGRRR